MEYMQIKGAVWLVPVLERDAESNPIRWDFYNAEFVENMPNNQ